MDLNHNTSGGPGGRSGTRNAAASRYLTAAAAFLAFAVSARADLVVNGGFELTSNGAGKQFDYLTTATGWTSIRPDRGNAYNFIVAPGAADTTGVTGTYGGLTFWGSNNGGLDVIPSSSPAGGNFVASDGAFQTGAISQTINGLTIGSTYIVGFWWAGAQQHGFDGANTEQWQVTFGGQTQSTGVVKNASHGFTGWQHESFQFTAASTSQTLSFLAIGTPNGVPPFNLLDGVTVNPTATPEPGTWALMLGGLGLVGIGAHRKKGKQAAKG